MDFAKKQLLKYGWKEGDGLGKNNDGMSSALKPHLKFDKFGIGHDAAKEFTERWWEEGYNSALNNINVSNGEDVQVSAEKNFDDVKKSSRKAKYDSFLKTSTLTNQGYVENVKESKAEINDEPIKHVTLTDEELLKACGKRTAHKGARHGLNLSGKLARIKAQEEELLLLFKSKNKSLDTNNSSDISKIKKKKKKKDKKHDKL